MAEKSADEHLGDLPAFSYLLRGARLGLPGASLLEVNTLVVLATVGALISAAIIDRTLTLPGQGVGLLEHPAIYVYLFSHFMLPPVLARSLKGLRDLPDHQSVLTPGFLDGAFPGHLAGLQSFIRRETPGARTLYSLLVFAGVLVFAWNSLQNQRPQHFLGFDFWDASAHACGYWVTRIYKLYVWGVLVPGLVLAQVGVVLSVNRILKDAIGADSLRIEPFHSDGCGGVSIFIRAVLTPLVPILVAAGGLAAAAWTVHRKPDLTTLGGLALAIAMFLAVYAWPAWTLRGCILREKQRKLDALDERQSNLFSLITDPDTPSADVHKLAELLNVLKALGDRGSRFAKLASDLTGLTGGCHRGCLAGSCVGAQEDPAGPPEPV